MPGWAKALIIVGVLIVLVVVGVVLAGVWWWSNNKDALLAGGKALIEEGQEAGREADNQGCVDQAITRYKAEPGFTKAISSGIFMESCLRVSSPTPGFCDEIPRETEFIKAGQWQLEQCQRVGLSSDQYCRQLLQGVQRFCDKQRP
ncbi:MAG TPA: hypothetical protein VE977_00020 [Pyrinomonadaceae bacterium]|nr:hypothetical protein [Pyrinomonadaceae bacterium]